MDRRGDIILFAVLAGIGHIDVSIDLRVMLFGCRASGEKSDLNNIYNIAVFVLQYYISTRLSGEIEKKSAIRKKSK